MQFSRALDLKEFIKKLVKEILLETISFPCKVKEYDGLFVKVESLLKDNDLGIIENVAVLQSPYLHLPIKENDMGICLNCDYLFYETMQDSEISDNCRSVGTNGLIFIPLVTEKNKQEDTESTILFNENRESKLTLKDKNLIYENKNTTLKIEDTNFTFDNKDIIINVENGNVIIDNQNITLTIKDNVLSIKGTLQFDTSAIKIEGMGGKLGEAFNQVFSAMDLLSTGLTGSSSNPAAYNDGKTAIQQAIKKIVE